MTHIDGSNLGISKQENVVKYSASQPRDERGRWTDGAGGSYVREGGTTRHHRADGSVKITYSDEYRASQLNREFRSEKFRQQLEDRLTNGIEYTADEWADRMGGLADEIGYPKAEVGRLLDEMSMGVDGLAIGNARDVGPDARPNMTSAQSAMNGTPSGGLFDTIVDVMGRASRRRK